MAYSQNINEFFLLCLVPRPLKLIMTLDSEIVPAFHRPRITYSNTNTAVTFY
jgi:hypothetical protein